jgi:antitoxin (DNA-binding transcriptional repressor) of toxin-antitoxin stability system
VSRYFFSLPFTTAIVMSAIGIPIDAEIGRSEGLMITVSKSVLQANVLEYFRRVEEGEELIVTHNQVPVLKVVPLQQKHTAAEMFADVRGRVKYHADVLEPETEEWGSSGET